LPLKEFNPNHNHQEMDFEILSQRIEDAAKKAFIEMFDKHGPEEIYAFALYSDEGAMTVCPATNTLEHLATAEEDDLPYSKFEPAEWKYEMQGAAKEFNEISAQLRDELGKIKGNNKRFTEFQKKLFATCIDILEKLKNENFFRKIIGKDIFLAFTISDYDSETKDLKNIISRLNDNEYKSEYLDWMKTWES
jgi:hypothetical protein